MKRAVNRSEPRGYPRAVKPAAPVATADVRLSYVIARLDRAVRRGIEGILAPVGLTVPQFTALSVLARRAGLSNAQLARRAYITPQSMHEVVLQLERRGLLERRPDPAHRRILRATVTARGHEVLARCEALVAEMEETMLAGLDDAAGERLAHDLAACVHALGAGLPALR